MKKQFNAMKGQTKQILRIFIETLFILDFSQFDQDPLTALIDAAVTIMDAYALARMFRSFRQVKGKHSEDPSNIIVYAGAYHTARYARFLTLLVLNKPPKRVHRRRMTCVSTFETYRHFFWWLTKEIELTFKRRRLNVVTMTPMHSSNVRILAIGDPHFQTTNIPEVELFIERMTALAQRVKPDRIAILGDLLHYHERLHTMALNKAYELIRRMRGIAKTFVLVGNHDMINHQQFLTDNHWMNGVKEWDNVEVVDTVRCERVNDELFVFVPFVPPGRFEEALNTCDANWQDATCIFAHQEFFGCQMGAIVSSEGDRWSEKYPHVVSGHIHARQRLQPNVYYTGSAMQHAFGESDRNSIADLTFTDGAMTLDEVDLALPRKRILYMDVEDVDELKLPTTEDKLKVSVSGNYQQFKALKKTKKYKQLVKQGVKVVFRPTKEKSVVEQPQDELGSFMSILSTLVEKAKDPELSHALAALTKA